MVVNHCRCHDVARERFPVHGSARSYSLEMTGSSGPRLGLKHLWLIPYSSLAHHSHRWLALASSLAQHWLNTGSPLPHPWLSTASSLAPPNSIIARHWPRQAQSCSALTQPRSSLISYRLKFTSWGSFQALINIFLARNCAMIHSTTYL